MDMYKDLMKLTLRLNSIMNVCHLGSMVATTPKEAQAWTAVSNFAKSALDYLKVETVGADFSDSESKIPFLNESQKRELHLGMIQYAVELEDKLVGEKP